MTDLTHVHPAMVALERFKHDPSYADWFYSLTPCEKAVAEKMFLEGWLSRDVPPAKALGAVQ